MTNNGVNVKGVNNNGDMVIKNKTTIKKGHIIISIFVIMIIIGIFFFGRNNKPNIAGTWITDEGTIIEFMSDGTMHEENSHTSLYADTWELMDEGYLKLGTYDTAWIAYRYSYWEVDFGGNKMTLTNRDNAEISISLTKK